MSAEHSSEHFRVTETHARGHQPAFAEAVRRGLGVRVKSLPCQFIYDAQGSALFERICALDEYYPPRAEREIIERHARDVALACPSPCEVVELGSGSAEKTRPLLAALSARQGPVRYMPIDVSRSALEESAQRMFGEETPLTIHALLGDYESALSSLPRRTSPRLFVWLGSSIGNLDRRSAARFLSELPIGPDDRAFVGIDLRKGRATLERAYDDPQGVTRQFICNVLERINRELGGRFDVDAFEYLARYDGDEGVVSMSLRSRRAQTVPIEGLDMRVQLAAGETIHVENSYKYSDEEIDVLARAAGLEVERRFYDDARLFCDVLLARRERAPS